MVKGNQVSYGPHLFPGGPQRYIRAGDIGASQAHENVKGTLIEAFSDQPDSILSQVAERFGVETDSKVQLSFMNYGNMQLVYLATLADRVRLAVLVNQPHTPLGSVKKEFKNLKRVVKIDPRFVVEPFAYFSRPSKGHELYVAEYVENAMCIAHLDAHGVYDPLPNYHFEPFSQDMGDAVNSSMVALLVNYHSRGCGLAKTQVSGNDFVLTRGFRKDDPSTVQPNIRLIAARDFIKIGFKDYLDLLRKEFLIGTDRDNDSVQINVRSKLPMTSEQIENGIELGLKLREER